MASRATCARATHGSGVVVRPDGVMIVELPQPMYSPIAGADGASSGRLQLLFGRSHLHGSFFGAGTCSPVASVTMIVRLSARMTRASPAYYDSQRSATRSPMCFFHVGLLVLRS